VTEVNVGVDDITAFVQCSQKVEEERQKKIDAERAKRRDAVIKQMLNAHKVRILARIYCGVQYISGSLVDFLLCRTSRRTWC